MYSNVLLDQQYLFDSSGRWLPDAKWRQSSNGKWWFGYKNSYLYDETYYLDNNRYYFDANGYMMSGWFKYPDSDDWCYANATSDTSGPKGSIHYGWKKINGKWYNMYYDGRILTNTIVDDKYYMSYSGAWMPDAKWHKSSGRWWFGSGKEYLRQTAVPVNEKYYAFDKNGWMVSNSWYKLDGLWLYASDSGEMVTGWQTINGKRYHFTEPGFMNRNTEVDGIRLGSDGAAIE